MFSHSVGLCSPPLQVINLVCRYFKFIAKCMVFKWVFTHQALFPLTFYLVFCIHHSCLLVVPACVLLKTLQINWGLVWGCTKIPGGECHRHKIRVKEKTMRFRCGYSNWGFWQWCWQIYRWTMAFPLCMHSGFPSKRIEQTIMMS